VTPSAIEEVECEHEKHDVGYTTISQSLRQAELKYR